jgi:small-conductance mechanosensitive channel
MIFNDLPNFFEQEYFGNTANAWLIAITVFVIGVTAIAAVKAFVLSRLTVKAKTTETEVDDILVDLLRQTRPYFYTILVLYAAAHTLVLPNPLSRGLHFLRLAAVLLQLFVWGSGLIDYFVKRYTRRSGESHRSSSIATIRAIGFAGRFLLLVIVVLIALQNLGFNITALVAGLGIGGVAVALAIQNILSDLFAALSIMVDKPFVIGDVIAVDNFTGTVERIGLKTTRLRSDSGEQLIFSNGDLLKSRIRNYKRMYERRVAFTIKVPYNTDRTALANIPDIIQKVIESHDQVRFVRSHFLSFGDSSLNIETVYYMLTPDFTRYADTQQTINLSIMKEFDAAGIEFA